MHTHSEGWQLMLPALVPFGRYRSITPGDAHPGLYRKALFMKAGDLHWIDPAERMRAGQRRRFRGTRTARAGN